MALTSKIEHGVDAFVVGAIGLLIVYAVFGALTGSAATIMNTILTGLSSAVTTFAAPFFIILAAILVYGAYRANKSGK